MKLYIHIDTNTGFQFDGDAVTPDGYLFDPASHQRFVKFGEAERHVYRSSRRVIVRFAAASVSQR